MTAKPTQRTDTDCFSACLSWLLGLPQDQVPDFTSPEDGKFYHNVADFLRPRGLRMMPVEWNSMPAYIGGPVIARGISPRKKAHAVLWDDSGLLHDPHPSRAGLIGEPTHAMLILALPVQQEKRPPLWIRHGRRRPYTEIGIARLPCFRCGGKAKYQWQICSDGNIWRPLCTLCDVDLNRMVLHWMGDPDAERKITEYAASR